MTLIDIILLGWVVNIISVIMQAIYVLINISNRVGFPAFVLWSQKNRRPMTYTSWLRLLLPFSGLMTLVMLIWKEYKYFQKNPDNSYLDFLEYAIKEKI